ncbi:MAG: sugar phosphate isomerase/epimerase family protein [Armatimonadota bacterium]
MIDNPERFGFYIDPLDPRLEQRLRWLRELGMRQVGFDGMGRREAGALDHIQRQVHNAGVEVLVIHGEPPLVAPDGDDEALLQQHFDVLDRAVHFGARIVVLHYRLSMDPNLDLADHDRRMTKLLRTLAPRAADCGLTLALENVPLQYPFGYRIDELVEYLTALDLPNVRLCLDSGHAHLCGLDIAECVRQAGDWLLTTHFHDNFGLSRADQAVAAVDRHLVPGLGTIHWPAVILALEECNFPGPIMFEGVRTIPHGPGPDFEPSVTHTLQNWALLEKVAHTLSEPIVR